MRDRERPVPLTSPDTGLMTRVAKLEEKVSKLANALLRANTGSMEIAVRVALHDERLDVLERKGYGGE